MSDDYVPLVDGWVALICQQEVEAAELDLRHADQRLMWQAVHAHDDLTEAQDEVGQARIRLAAARAQVRK